MKLLLIIVVAVALLFLLTFYLGQSKLIYFPRNYSANKPELERVTAHVYESGGYKQWVYLLKRDNDLPPDRIWWLFGGNGSTALGWVSLVAQVDPSINQAFVLFEYPGYGFNSGSPSPESIFQSIDDSLGVVAGQLGLSEPELAKRSIGLGHSLGCAVALESANRHGWSEVVAISPFTSMKAMARRQVGSVLAAFLRHHYDNEVALDELLVSNSNSRVTIFHGENDALIPITMGQSLAERDESGEKVVFIEVPRAGHNDIIMYLEAELMARFNQP